MDIGDRTDIEAARRLVGEDDRRVASAYYREALALYEMLGHAGFAAEARALLQSTAEAGG